ncbi:MAG: D-alanyl-D-alanine dipeptidase [Rickettsiales bacterium]|nr:D-alanyl-D-alanine dipeptidase [Rickettsiales bacterium]
MNHNFVKVNQNQLDVDIDLRYASKNNFTGNKIYLSESCFLHKIAFEHLCIAVDIAKKIGLKIKIFDAYRPTYVQKKLWDTLPDPSFIAPPKKGSPHSRGVAIDITLIKNGKELDMGTEFDEFSKLSYHGCLNISKMAYQNRLTLLGIMTDSGWDFYRNEWWHYQLFDSKNYKIIDNIES